MNTASPGPQGQDAPDVTAILVAYDYRPDCLIEILHDVQAHLGYVPDSVVPQLARGLNLSRAEIHGVITFYHDFHRAPVGRHTVRICRAEACQARGCRSLEAHAAISLGVAFGETPADGDVTLEPTYCLGNCALGPAALVGDELIGMIDEARADALVAEARR